MSSITDYLSAPAWAIEPRTLESITRQLASAKGASDFGHVTPPKAPTNYSNVGGVGVIPVHGVIMRRADQVNGRYQARGTSLEQLQNDIAAARADTSASSVVLDIDSPGGSVDGIIDAAAALRDLRATKTVHAHVNGMAASAGYWLASQADKVFATAGSQVGSIGVYAPLVDDHRLYESVGLDIKYVSSVPGKVAQNLSGKPLDLATMTKAQESVSAWHERFVGDIAKGRNVPTETASAWGDASMHFASEAQTLGLIDGVTSREQTIQALQQNASKRVDLGAKPNGRMMNAQNEGAPQAVAPSVPTSAQDLRETYPEAVQAIERDAVARALKPEQDRINAIVKACTGKGEAVIRVGLGAIASGSSAVDALTAMLEVTPVAAAPVSATSNQFPTPRTFATSQVQPLGSAPLPEAPVNQERKPKLHAEAKREWDSLPSAVRAEFDNDFIKWAVANGGTTLKVGGV